MPSLIRALLVIALAAHAAAAQVPDATPSCVENCGGGSSSSSNNDAGVEAVRAERRERIRVEAENAARASAQARIHTIRKSNESGVDAYQHKQYGLAEAYFEAALKIDPNDTMARRNLDATRAKIASLRADREQAETKRKQDAAIGDVRRQMDAEQHRLAKLLAHGPPVPPPSTGTTKVTTELTRSVPLAIPGGYDFVMNAERAKQIALGVLGTAKGFLELTPEGMYFAVQANVTKLATDTVPDMITHAASGTATPEPILGAQGATIVLNMTPAGDAAEDVAAGGSATTAVSREAIFGKLDDLAHDGIGRLSKEIQVRSALAGAKELVKRWTGDEDKAP